MLEITRFCLGRRQNGRRRLETRDLLVSALVRYALDHGINTYSGVAEIGWLQQILAFGWRCRPLGLPQRIGGKMLGALRIDITPDTPRLLEANGIHRPTQPSRRRCSKQPDEKEKHMSPHNHIDTLISRWSERLLVDGYCIIPDLLPRETIEALDPDLAREFEITPFCEGGFYGSRTKRFGRILARSPHAASLVQHELVIGIVERILSP